MKFTADLLKKSAIRALHTFLQVVGGSITVGVAIHQIEWLPIISVAATSAVISFIKSLVIGIPESGIIEGSMVIDNTNEDDPKVDLDFGDLDFADMVDAKAIKLSISKGTVNLDEE